MREIDNLKDDYLSSPQIVPSRNVFLRSGPPSSPLGFAAAAVMVIVEDLDTTLASWAGKGFGRQAFMLQLEVPS